MKAVYAARRRGQTPVGAGHQEQRLRTRALAWAGILGPVLFTATFVTQELFRIEEYSPLAEPVSALEAGPNGWVQQVNFLVLGVLTVAFAIGLHRGVGATRRGVVGPALLAVSGIGSVVAGIFPLREDAAGVTYDPGGHLVGGVMFFVTSALGLVVLSRRLARDPRWRSLAAYTLLAGLLAVAAAIAQGPLVMADDAPLHDWAGLVQRVVVLAVLFPCRIVLSLRLLHLATRP